MRHRLQLGFAGAGWIGRMRMQALAETAAAKIVAVADSSQEALAEVASIAPEAALLHDFDELLDMELDGVVIATPNALHATQATAVLNAGMAVFCQKPVGRSAYETRELLRVAQQMDRLVSTDFAYRFTAGMQAIKALINGGELGSIYAAELCFHNSYGPDKAWYYNREMSGGGCVLDLGTHLVDLALWPLKFVPVDRVSSRLFAKGCRLRPYRGEQVEDFAFADIELENGVAVHLACSWGRPLGCDSLIRVIYHGERGAAELRNVNGSFFDFTACHYRGREGRLLSSPPDDWSGRALLNWIERLSMSNKFTEDAWEIAKVAEIVDAIYSGTVMAPL